MYNALLGAQEKNGRSNSQFQWNPWPIIYLPVLCCYIFKESASNSSDYYWCLILDTTESELSYSYYTSERLNKISNVGTVGICKLHWFGKITVCTVIW